MYAIGIDIGGTSLRIGTVSSDGVTKLLEKYRQTDILNDDPPNDLAAFISDYINRNCCGGEIAGLCIGLPATLNRDKSTVLSAPNIKGFDKVNLKAILQKCQEFPVFLLKDVSALFYCDRKQMSFHGEDVVLAFYIGTGLGNVICIGGKVLEGGHGVAGELGHIPISGFNDPCGCGNSGCAELLCAGKYLDRLCAEVFPQCPIKRLFVDHASHPLLKEYIDCLASVIATEINILDPSSVILGGGVICMPDFPVGILQKSIRQRTRKPMPEQGMRFFISKDNGYNGVIGAGLHVWDQLNQ